MFVTLTFTSLYLLPALSNITRDGNSINISLMEYFMFLVRNFFLQNSYLFVMESLPSN